MAPDEDAVAVLEESYGAMVRIATYRGAQPPEGDELVRAAVVAGAPGGLAGLRERLVRELVFLVAEREQAAGRSVAVVPEPDPSPAVADERFEPDDAVWAGFFLAMPASLDALAPG